MTEKWYFGTRKKAHVWTAYCHRGFQGYTSICGLLDESIEGFTYLRKYNGWQNRCKTCTRLLALKKVA